MKKKQVFALCLALLLVCNGVSMAASGITKSYTFDGSVAVWDISGTYSEDDLSMAYTMAQDGKGKITGYGHASYSEPGVSLSMDFVVKGKIKSQADVVSVVFSMKAKGVADTSYGPYKFSASVAYNAIIDALAEELSGTMKMTMKMAGYKESIEESFTEDLPEGMDGSVDLDLTLQDGGKSLYGRGTLTLSNGEQLNYVAKGKLDEKKAEGKFSLKGEGVAKGSAFKMETDMEYNLTEGKAKVMGQKLQL